MYFIAKCAFCLALILLLLPDEQSDQAARELTKAVYQDGLVKGAVERTKVAAEHVATEAPKCMRNHDECLDTAKRFVKGATGR